MTLFYLVMTPNDFFISICSQQQRIAHVIKQPNQSMCMAESAISTLHTWLMSDPMVKSMGESDDNSVTLWDDASNNEPTCLHVINAGVECSGE